MTLLLDDPSLLVSFRAGDRGALERVYRFYSPEVARWLAAGGVVSGEGVRSRLRLTAVELQEVHQDTFVRAFRLDARLAYDGLRPFGAWLRVVARSAAIDALRRRQRDVATWMSLDELTEDETPAHTDRSPEDHVLQDELRRRVRAFLDSLSPELRALAERRFVDGISQQDAGAGLGLSRQQIRSRERHLKHAFVAHLARTGWIAVLLMARTMFDVR
jgi:RNA polymerase sigma-70 factor, ECF subfamily